MNADAVSAALVPLHESPVARLMRCVGRWLRVDAAAGKCMRHVETLPLGRNKSLYLVECDGMRFLVSAGGDCLSAPVPVGLPVNTAAMDAESTPRVRDRR